MTSPSFVPHPYSLLLSRSDEVGASASRRFYLRHDNGALAGQPYGTTPIAIHIEVSPKGLFEVQGAVPVSLSALVDNLRRLFQSTLPIFVRACENDELESSAADCAFLQGLLDAVLPQDTAKQVPDPY